MHIILIFFTFHSRCTSSKSNKSDLILAIIKPAMALNVRAYPTCRFGMSPSKWAFATASAVTEQASNRAKAQHLLGIPRLLSVQGSEQFPIWFASAVGMLCYVMCVNYLLFYLFIKFNLLRSKFLEALLWGSFINL